MVGEVIGTWVLMMAVSSDFPTSELILDSNHLYTPVPS